jgi:ABC-type uncharacterized transport system ATPase subunit
MMPVVCLMCPYDSVLLGAPSTQQQLNTDKVTSRRSCCFVLQGTMTLLLGSPGSGKSTLLKLLSGRLNSKHLQVQAG